MKNILEEEAELTSINEISKGIDKHNGYQKYGRYFHKNTEKKEEIKEELKLEKKLENEVRISRYRSVGKININNIENKQNENGKQIINYYNKGDENGGYNFRAMEQNAVENETKKTSSSRFYGNQNHNTRKESILNQKNLESKNLIEENGTKINNYIII